MPMSAVEVPMPDLLSDEARIHSRLADYLQTQTKRRWTLGRFTRYAVGFSWITYGFSAQEEGVKGERGLILRLGPPYGLFAPYSALPQHAALKALEGTKVPAPRSYWWSDDVSILGAPFFISERVAGSAPVPWVRDSATRAPLAGVPNARTGMCGPELGEVTSASPGSATLSPTKGIDSGFEDSWRLSIGNQFVSAIAALHGVEWRNKEGFVDSGITVENAALRQVEEWERNYARWTLKPYAMLSWAFRWLRRNLPVAPRVSLVHGDYRLGNFLEQDGRITAILDWELVHLGDPHEDLGWAFLPQYSGGSGLVCRLLSKEDFIAQYEREASFKVDPAALRFYLVFSLVKLAITHIAAVRCYEDGRFNDLRMPAMGTQIAPVLRQISKMLPAGANNE